MQKNAVIACIGTIKRLRPNDIVANSTGPNAFQTMFKPAALTSPGKSTPVF